MTRRVPALIVGAGAAALRAALELPGALLVTKGALPQAGTFHAQGGVAAALGEDDAIELHERDTLEAGRGLCDPVVVREVVAEGPERIRELIAWGARFDTAAGRIAFAREGAHSRARILHRGDRTGREILRVLLDRARRRVEVLERTFVVDLIQKRGRCCGVVAWNADRGLFPIAAGAVILATGGAGRVYRETTNPEMATGDGIAMAARAGAWIMDMEFIQFHPTVLYLAGAPRALISEAVRGAGAVLRDRTGRAFMQDMHPLADLAPRDECARAILRRMIETDDTQVYLDVTLIPPRVRRRSFPGLERLCRRYGLGPSAIPVRFAAHYTIGGVRTDLEGRTGIEGVYACGECAATGFHGANRLGSNSLLECLVMGRRAGAAAAADHPAAPRHRLRLPAAPRRRGTPIDVADMAASLRSLMAREAGLVRDGPSLERARDAIRFWSSLALDAPHEGPAVWELRNMLQVAQAVVLAALARRESRGVHHRRDHPDADPAWAQHLVIRQGRIIYPPSAASGS